MRALHFTDSVLKVQFLPPFCMQVLLTPQLFSLHFLPHLFFLPWNNANGAQIVQQLGQLKAASAKKFAASPPLVAIHETVILPSAEKQPSLDMPFGRPPLMSSGEKESLTSCLLCALHLLGDFNRQIRDHFPDGISSGCEHVSLN